MIVVARAPMLGGALFFLSGCHSAPSTRSVSPAFSEFTANELAFIRTDSEVFEGVVRGQLAGTEKEHPFHLESPIFDSQPYGWDSADVRYFATLSSEDSSFLKALSKAAVNRVIENRKAILRSLNVDEGKRVGQRCPGALISPRPIPADSASYAIALAKLRVDCPTKAYSHLEVSPPIRGVSSSLYRLLERYRQVVHLQGELWTAIVNGSYASKGGGMADEYAWIFQREPQTGRLRLLTTIMIGIAE